MSEWRGLPESWNDTSRRPRESAGGGRRGLGEGEAGGRAGWGLLPGGDRQRAVALEADPLGLEETARDPVPSSRTRDAGEEDRHDLPAGVPPRDREDQVDGEPRG